MSQTYRKAEGGIRLYDFVFQNEKKGEGAVFRKGDKIRRENTIIRIREARNVSLWLAWVIFQGKQYPSCCVHVFVHQLSNAGSLNPLFFTTRQFLFANRIVHLIFSRPNNFSSFKSLKPPTIRIVIFVVFIKCNTIVFKWRQLATPLTDGERRTS